MTDSILMDNGRIKAIQLVLILAILYILPSKGNTQPLHWQSMGGPHDPFYLISPYPNVVFALGQAGGQYSYRSLNNGDSWIQMPDVGYGQFASNKSTIFSTDRFLQSFDSGVIWKNMNLHGGSESRVGVAIVDTGIFACVSDGYYNDTYLSSNNGISWTNINNSAGFGIKFLVAVRNTIFAGTNEGIRKLVWDTVFHLWKWNLMKSFVLADEPSYVVVDSILYVGADQGIYMTADFGKKWSKISLPTPNKNINILTKKDSFLFAAQSVNGAFRSSDGGHTWTSICYGISPNITSLAVSDSFLLASSEDGLYRSSNDGNSWQQINTGLPYSHIFAITTDKDIPIISTGGPTYTFQDTGRKWLPFDDYQTPVGGIRKFIRGGNNIFARGGYVNEVVRSMDKGKSWNLCAHFDTIDCAGLFAIQLVDTTIFGFTGIGIYKSTNYGNSWQHIDNNLTDQVIASASLGSRFIAATFGNNNSAIYSSSDFGNTWVFIDSLQSNVKDIFVSGSTIFVGTDSLGIYRSLDSGRSFHQIFSPPFKTINCMTGNERIIFISEDSNGIYYSTNRGDSWTQSNYGLPSYHINALSLGRSKLFAGTDSGVFQTSLVDSLTSGILYSPTTMQLSLLPNPAKDELYINFDSEQFTKAEIEIYDLLGRQVLKVSDNTASTGVHLLKLNTHYLDVGAYILHIQSGSQSTSRKIEIIH